MKKIDLLYKIISFFYLSLVVFRLFFEDKLVSFLLGDINKKGVIDTAIYEKETCLNNLSFAILITVLLIHLLFSIILIFLWKKSQINKMVITSMLLLDIFLILLATVNGVFSQWAR